MAIAVKCIDMFVIKSRHKLINKMLSVDSRLAPFCGVRYLSTRDSPLTSPSTRPPPTSSTKYDYVVVGAGSAGCIVANRLSKDPRNQVLLIEAGPEDKSWKFAMPAALMYTLSDKRYNWKYYTQPQRHVNNRSMYWPRGKVWGGCSSHNAMVYVRGHADDYDRWAEQEGAAGWTYAECLPYFKSSTTHAAGEDDYRGKEGLQFVEQGNGSNNPLHRAFLDAAVETGYPFSNDINGYQQEGFGYLDMTIEKGVRASTSTGFLRPALHRRNLHVISESVATRILVETGPGVPRATGIAYRSSRGAEIQVMVDREVILCGGPMNSPQLLMLSGIGDGDHLKQHNIPIIHHLPGVGSNLQDHLEVYIQHKCLKPCTLYEYQWKFPLKMAKTGIEWFKSHTGAASTTHLESGGFIRSQPGISHPDIQFHFLPSIVSDHGQKMSPCHAFQVHVGTMRPTSRGTVRLQSRDPMTPPLIDPNYLATERDRVDMRACVRLSREIFQASAFDEFRGKEMLPGSEVTSDEKIDAFVREYGDSAYHPSSTCKMGSENKSDSVVDPECKVIGVKGLRVVDSSIMPSLVSGNLNAPTIMIGEKASDIILGNEPLPPANNVQVYRPKNLDTQR